MDDDDDDKKEDEDEDEEDHHRWKKCFACLEPKSKAKYFLCDLMQRKLFPIFFSLLNHLTEAKLMNFIKK